MRPRAALALACLFYLPATFAQVEAGLQNLLAGLTQGTEVVLYTPLANGLIEVTRFQPPLALPRPQAEAALAIAREHLRLLAIEYPTPDQLATALVGGAIPNRDGPQQLPGVLPTTGRPARVTRELVLANGAPIVPAPASAAAGGSSSATQLLGTPHP
jgi:hypothetical protein